MRWRDGTSVTGSNVTHVYASTGIYTAMLTVVDNDAAAATANIRVEVQPVSSKPIPVIAGPEDVTVNAGTTVVFYGAGSRDQGGVITNYTWAFGDGGRGRGMTGLHDPKPVVFSVLRKAAVRSSNLNKLGDRSGAA